MPLFKAIVEVSCFVDIPVSAKNLEEAIEYFKSKDDWKDDLGLEGINKQKISFKEMLAVNSPSEVTFHGRSICWNVNGEEEPVAYVFYDPPYPKYNGQSEKEMEVLRNEFFKKEELLIEKFDSLVKEPGLLKFNIDIE